MNENSKELCWHHAIPEMNHNELVGWAGGKDDIELSIDDARRNHGDPRTDASLSRPSSTGDASR